MTGKLSPKAFEINSNWSSLPGYEGWKHFRIAAKRSTDEGHEIELMAVCDRDIRVWFLLKTFRKDPNWVPGWM